MFDTYAECGCCSHLQYKGWKKKCHSIENLSFKQIPANKKVEVHVLNTIGATASTTKRQQKSLTRYLVACKDVLKA